MGRQIPKEEPKKTRAEARPTEALVVANMNALMAAHGENVGQICGRVGIPKTTFHTRLREPEDMRLSEIVDFCNYYGISPARLFRDEKADNDTPDWVDGFDEKLDDIISILSSRQEELQKMTDHKTIPEKADELFRRIEAVLDDYTVDFEERERNDELTEEFSDAMMLAEHYIPQFAALCELDPVGFIDTYADIADMDDNEIFHEVLVKGKGLENV